MKMCLGLHSKQSWEIWTEMHQMKILSTENQKYLNILLATAIYLRTSAYLKSNSQTNDVQIDKYHEGRQDRVYTVLAHLFVLMGYLLVQIKQFVCSAMPQVTTLTDLSLLPKRITVSLENHWLLAKVLYFTGQYESAKKAVSKSIDQPLDSDSDDMLWEIISQTTPQTSDFLDCKDIPQKRAELCAYLSYYTKKYNSAVRFFNYFIFTQKGPHGLWKLLAAHCSNEIGDYIKAQELLRDAEKDVESSDSGNLFKETDDNNRDTSEAYSSIGSVYFSLSQYDKAFEYHTKALKMNETLYGETVHYDLAVDYNKIGLVYHSQGDYGKALEYNTKSLDMRKAIYGAEANHSDIATSNSNIGLVYNSLGDYVQALEHCTKSLDMHKGINGAEANHADIATSYNNIGSALEYYTKSLDMRKAIYGAEANHTDIARGYNNIGSVSDSLEKEEKTEYLMDVIFYIEWLARTYKEKAEQSGYWRHYLQMSVHSFKPTRLKGGEVHKENLTPARRRLVYEIEKSWYKGNHHLSYDQHQQLINEHKQLLTNYREGTREDFAGLDSLVEALDTGELSSERSLKNAEEFCLKLFQASGSCTDGLIKVSRILLQDSVAILKQEGKYPPCQFALIGLGSITEGEATPYSDLEYALIVEKESEYFEKLAVDTYFRIGNLGESPLKGFDIGELKGSEYLDSQMTLFTTGYRIDGITKNSGNIPTGNGRKGGHTLTLTVYSLMDLYRQEAEAKFDGFPGDKSDMFSSNVVILSNGETPDSSQVYDHFIAAREHYENSVLNETNAVQQKRLDSFRMDIDKFSFVPDFVKFQPPNNLNVRVKEKIFRYPTLLANNMKMCLGLHSKRSWEIWTEMHQLDILSTKNQKYLNILLATAIYLRTSAYLNSSSQTNDVQIDKYHKGRHDTVYTVPTHLFVLMGYLLVQIKKCINSAMPQVMTLVDLSLLTEKMTVSLENHWLLAEVLYFTGQYESAKKVVSKSIGQPLNSDSDVGLWEIISQTTLQTSDLLDRKDIPQKRAELCAYLLYYTEIYKSAFRFFNYFIFTQEGQHGLWKLLAAHCSKEIGDYKKAQELVRDAEKDMESSESGNLFQITDDSNRDTSQTYESIGSMYFRLSEYDKAFEYHTKALKMDRNMYGENVHYDLAVDHNNIGLVYYSQGEYGQALEYYIKSLDMWKAIYGAETNQTDLAWGYNNIGSVYYSLGDYGQALEYYTKSLNMCKAIYGEEKNHTAIASSYNNIGSVYNSLGDYGPALEYHTKSFDMCKAIYGDDTDHTDIARGYNNVGSVYYSLGDYGQALEYHTKSLDICKAIYGDETNHTAIASSYNNIGSVYYSLVLQSCALSKSWKRVFALKSLRTDQCEASANSQQGNSNCAVARHSSHAVETDSSSAIE
ncbi:uncharacterized protein [Watersipora subatra]|uniref:uncharacterized protein n=1 Tax=Watersipora subatra TaxID=2589382 RepID=UPI00355BC79A